jgi:hypothetical protein
MPGRITKLEGSEQQHQQTNQEEDVDEVPGVVQAKYADEPDCKQEQSSLQEALASVGFGDVRL